MVHHMVWFRFHDGVPETRQHEHLDALAALKDKVPGIVALAVGENFTDRAQGYTHGLVVTLQSPDALKIYTDHPEHVPVAAALKRDADLLAMDIALDPAI